MTAENSVVELRMAEAADASVMLRLIQAAFSAREPVNPPAAALSDTVADIVTRLESGYGIIAEVDGEPAGCVLLTPMDEQVISLSRVSVVAHYRHHGLAAALVKAAAQVSSGLQAQWLELLCRSEFPETLAWWQRLGFEINRPHPVGDLLRRRLPVAIEVPTAAAMHRLGEALADHLVPGDLVIASGELGAGKTTFTQGLGEGLGVQGPVISPTFVLSRVHRSLTDGPALVHVDAYRLGSAAELEDIDLEASLTESVTVIEWGAGLAEGLADDRLEIDIQRTVGGSSDPEMDGRTVHLLGVGRRWEGVDFGPLLALADTWTDREA